MNSFHKKMISEIFQNIKGTILNQFLKYTTNNFESILNKKYFT